MANYRHTDLARFSNLDCEGVRDGQEVRVNGYHVGIIHLLEDGDFHIDGWDENEIIDLEVMHETTLDTANIHPTIKE